ncbi:MAG: DUF4445 domain-containing protein, partial [Candidatus Methanomethylophilaceae archaeon]|nr:DUF4445 domain-containing protein [Candidatus Methanomethylophilaceae archaeon]
TGDVRKAYMSGASGLYVDAIKAMGIGMVCPGATEIIQFGNTSIEMARKVALGRVDLLKLREFAKELRATHVMFATSETFKNLYSVEYSLWCTGMPMEQYDSMLDLYGLPPLSKPAEKITAKRLAKTDLPDVEKRGVIILEESKTVLTGAVEGCIGCKKCVRECPEKALSIVKESGGFRGYVKSDRCAGTACRRCERICEHRCLSLRNFVIVRE